MGTAYDDVTAAGASPTVWQPLPRQVDFPFRRSRMFPTIQATVVWGGATKKTHS
jgi:hypothetical protein